MERWGLFSVVSSSIVYFLTTMRAVCPNINPIMLCAHICDVNFAVCYWIVSDETFATAITQMSRSRRN